MLMNYLKCPICDCAAKQTERIAGKFRLGKFGPREFSIYRCSHCHFAFVGNPILDYEQIYTEEYYRGQGADPLVDYYFELEHPEETIRQYEWRGLVSVIQDLITVSPQTRWLDYGCGNGGLVRYVHQKRLAEIYGFDEGEIVTRAKALGIPLLESVQLENMSKKFDIVTAIEVLEHIPDPIQILEKIRQLIRPQGLFFFTTGNARPFRNKITKWSYVIPEIHTSYYEPETLFYALEKTGFKAEFTRWFPGWSDIIRFKILKNLGIRRKSLFEALLPWGLLTKLANQRYGVTHHPIGWAK